MNCVRRGTRLWIALYLAVVYPACVATTARFVQSDKSFQARPRTAPPKVFIEEAPETPFGSVGIVEVKGPVTATKEALMNAAVSKATELGCDVLVHQALYEMRQAGPRGGHPNGVAAWLFTCGVFDMAKQTKETARLADGTAQEIVRREYGEPVCTTQAPTGSHMRRNICRLPGVYRVWGDGTPWVANVRLTE